MAIGEIEPNIKSAPFWVSNGVYLWSARSQPQRKSEIELTLVQAVFFRFLGRGRPRLTIGRLGRGSTEKPSRRPGELPRGLTEEAGVPIS